MWQDLCVYNTDYDGLGPGFLERPGSPGGSGEGGAHSCEDGRAASRRSCNPAEEPGQTSQESNLSQGLGEGQR